MAWIESRKKTNGAQPLPYIAANGNQIVTLPIFSDDYPVIKTKLMTISPTGQQVFIGDIFDVNGVLLYAENNVLSALYFRYNNSSYSTINNVKWCEPVEIEIDYTDGSIKYDGVLYAGAAKTQLHNAIKLFGQNTTTRRALVYIFELKIYVNNVLTMDLVPMKNSNTGEGYLHDIVGNQDYYSETSVPLIYGEFSA